MRRLLALPWLLIPIHAACSSTGTTGGSSTTGGGSGGGGAGGGLDAGQDASDGGDAGACTLLMPYSTKDKPCNDCAEAKCCAEINGCLGDPGCNDDYVNCTIGCALDFDGGSDAGPVMCLDGCAAQFPKGKAEYDVAIGCADQSCLVECQ